MEFYKGIINIEASKELSKEQIYEIVKGSLNEDFEAFYLGLQKANGTHESLDKPSKQSKKS